MCWAKPGMRRPKAASRLARFTVSATLAPTCGSRAERAMLRSCSLCATPRLARITCGFCLSASWTASRKVSLRGAGSWAKGPAASASRIGILSFMVQGGAPGVPKMGRQVIGFTWIIASLLADGCPYFGTRRYPGQKSAPLWTVVAYPHIMSTWQQVAWTTFLSAFLAVGFSAPQNAGSPPPQHPEIRGVVLEPGTNQPVVDAEIELSVQTPGPVKINGGWKADPSRKSRTDFSGVFRLPLDKPGPYRVEAKKAGYSAPAAGEAACRRIDTEWPRGGDYAPSRLGTLRKGFVRDRVLSRKLPLDPLHGGTRAGESRDSFRKSTRLNSSHLGISYA